MTIIENNLDYAILEYTENEFYLYLEDEKKYTKSKKLVDSYKGYCVPFYYLIIDNGGIKL